MQNLAFLRINNFEALRDIWIQQLVLAPNLNLKYFMPLTIIILGNATSACGSS